MKSKKSKAKRTWKRYVVLESGHFIDLWDEEMDSMFCNSTCQKDYFIRNKKLYCKYSYEELDDWYADIGAITHWESETRCLGKIKYASDYMLTIVNNCWLCNDTTQCILTVTTPNAESTYDIKVTERINKELFKNVTKIYVDKYIKKSKSNETFILTPYKDSWFKPKIMSWLKKEVIKEFDKDKEIAFC